MPKACRLNRKDVDRYETLKQDILRVGFFRRGSLVRRFMPCGKPGCRCQAPSPKLHGPYYQWTRKIRGKTVTVRLTRRQAELLAEWIANGRRLDAIILQMENASMRLTEQIWKQSVASPPTGNKVAPRKRR